MNTGSRFLFLLNPSKCKALAKFLIIRFSSIGDIVLTTPVIRILKKQVENATIHFITKKAFEPVMRENPFIDRLWLYEDNLEEISDLLKKENFDYIIDLHNNLRSEILKRKLKRPSFAFNKINLEKWLVVNLKINRLPHKHIVDRYLETLKSFEIENDKEGLDYFLSKKDCLLPSSIEEKMPLKFISLVAGAQHFTKKAPPAKLAQICNRLKYPIVILGGPADSELAERIIQFSDHEDIINLCGKLSLNQSACVVKRSAVVVSHDTGLMHIASAFKKRIISIWGNTVPEFGMYPYFPGQGSKIFEVEGLSCRPCSKIGFSSCPKKHFKCMVDQDVNAIAEAINQALITR